MKNIKLDAEQRIYLIRLLNKEAHELNTSATNLLKIKESKIEEYEHTISMLEYTNTLITNLGG